MAHRYHHSEAAHHLKKAEHHKMKHEHHMEKAHKAMSHATEERYEEEVHPGIHKEISTMAKHKMPHHSPVPNSMNRGSHPDGQLINEEASAPCHLPTNVIDKTFGKGEHSYGLNAPNDLYDSVEEQITSEASEIHRNTKPTKY